MTTPIPEDHTVGEMKEETVFTLDPSQAVPEFVEAIPGQDPFAKIALKRKRAKIAKIVLSLIGIVLFTLLMLQYTKSPNSEPQKAKSNATVTTTNTEQIASLPLTSLYLNAPKVMPGVVTTSVLDDTITTSTNHSLTITRLPLEPASTACQVTQPTDFCIAARGNVAGTQIEIYYLKDAVHSRLFENPTDFNPITTPKGKSATLTIQIGEKKYPALIMAHEDSSGWMIISKNPDPMILAPILAITTLK